MSNMYWSESSSLLGLVVRSSTISGNDWAANARKGSGALNNQGFIVVRPVCARAWAFEFLCSPATGRVLVVRVVDSVWSQELSQHLMIVAILRFPEL